MSNGNLQHQIRELGSTRIHLRGDLVFTPQTSGGQAYYMVEDPLNSRFFRLGQTEYNLVSLLDGCTSLHEALSHLSTVMPHHRLTEAEAASLCRWLVEMDLAHSVESSQATRLVASARNVERRKAIARLNPLVCRVPLCRPDHAFQSLSQCMGWLYSPLATWLGVGLVAWGAYRVGSDWERFKATAHNILAPDNWLWLALAWLLLKIVHEISHGVVCKRYGGTVRETGVLFILLAPLAYVDVTSSWRFRSRWQRIHVAAAGMYVELLIAALGALVWSRTDSGWLSHLSFNVIVMASFTTLMFNANPLMKFDGYYILCDALDMPNLSVNGQVYLRYWARRYLLGVPATLPDWPGRQAGFIRVYAWASLMWRILVCVGLVTTAATLLHGAGIVLSAIAAVLWLGVPLLKFLKYFIGGKPGEQPRRLRFLLTVGSASLAGLLVLGGIPWPGACRAPAVVEYAPHTIVRAATAGFVSEIGVEGGQTVEQGQLLVKLDNRELMRDLEDLKLQIRQSEVRGRQLEQKGELAAEQAEAKQREALQSQLAEKQDQAQLLTVRAPCAGKIVRRDLAAMLGNYVEQGDEIVSLGDESRKELRVSISQDDVDAFTERVGRSISIDVPRRSLWQSRLDKVIPRATRSVLHPALIATNGGPLPVKQVVDRDTSAPAQSAHELLSPRFTAIVPLQPSQAALLRTGQRAHVRYRPYDESIGQHLFNATSRWLRRRLAQPVEH